MDSMKTKIAKIELHLHNFLEAANREFNDALKSWDNPHEKNKSFKNCGRKYVEIMELIEHNRKKNRSVSVELLNTTLQEHILCLFENRAATIHSETIYNHLLQFIQTHCQEQQTNNNYFKVSKP